MAEAWRAVRHFLAGRVPKLFQTRRIQENGETLEQRLRRDKNLKFDSNKEGVVSISASFSGIQVQRIDFTYGNILLDLPGVEIFGGDMVASFLGFLNVENGFYLDDLFGNMFGGAAITGDIEELTFQIVFGDEMGFFVFNDGSLNRVGAT